ncbi:Bcr/CflA family drug resistance efflux transporter [Sphaerisporangium siamense]|nr:Bcr/CflA family drug resistance efflux transporter [Sphaerisporangium siamense]
MTAMSTRPPGERLLIGTFLVLGSLTAFGPLAIDLYLPAMPDLARMLGTSDSLAQLTISACLVGLAVGQLVAGPLSDRVGRRWPLLIGVILFTLTSVLCALATSIWVLLVLRLLQGLCGAAGVVIARAIVRDMFEGHRTAKAFSHLMLITGVAPIVAPLLGGQILRFTDWRGLFVGLGAISLLILLGCVLVLRETHPPHLRQHGGAAGTFLSLRGLLADPVFRGYLIIGGLQSASLFTYISMSSFVLRQEHGVSPQGFSLIFAVNAVGLVLGSQVNGALVSRFGPERLLSFQLVVMCVAAAAVVGAALANAGLVVLLVPLWIVMAGMGGMGANTTALALIPYGHAAGSASALIGTSQFLVGAAVAPLASLVGTDSRVMGATIALATALSLLTLWRVDHARRTAPTAPAE